MNDNDDLTTNDELDEVLSYIDLVANRDDLALIQQHLSAKFSAINTMSIVRFNVGDNVGFSAKGKVKHGKITKVMRVNCNVLVGNSERWKVSAASLWLDE